MIDRNLLEPCLAATHSLDATREALERQEDQLRKQDQEQEEDRRQLERLLELVREDSVSEILDGNTPQDKPKRRQRIRNLKDRIEARTVARPVLISRIEEARRCVRDAECRWGDAILPITQSERELAQREGRSRLAEALKPSLVRMLAADIVQEELLGESVRTTNLGLDLFSGRIVVTQFLKTLNPRLRPDGLNLIAIEEAARVQARELIASIKGES